MSDAEHAAQVSHRASAALGRVGSLQGRDLKGEEELNRHRSRLRERNPETQRKKGSNSRSNG